MKKVRLVLLCMAAAVICGEGKLSADTPKKILFIGNSFTYQGPIPDVVRNLAIDAGWPVPEVSLVAVGGQSLNFHRNNPDSIAAIDQGGWDYVVLQEYSTKATDNIGDPAEFKVDATYLYDRVKSSSPDATIVMYETWARHEDNTMYPDSFVDRDEMQSQINAHYHDCVENYIPTHASSSVKTDVVLAPAGEVWHANYHDRNLLLHGDDLYHGGSLGQYVNGMAIYATIYHRKVEGLDPLLGVSEADALYLQQLTDQITGETVEQVGGSVNSVSVNDRICVDFGVTQLAAGNWNITGSPDGTIDNLMTDTGKITNADLIITDRFNDTNSNGTTTPDASLGIPGGASNDSFYGHTGEWMGVYEPTAQFEIANLDPELCYELTFYASRMGVSDNRQAQYTVSGLEGQSEVLLLDSANNTNEVVTSGLLCPTAEGKITVDVQKGPANNNGYGFFYLGVVIINVVEKPYLPEITQQPQLQLLEAGDSAVFNIELQEPEGVSYQWYIDSVESGNEVVNDSRISGATTSELIIADAGIADEYEYICQLSSIAGECNSNPAKLVVKRLLSYWPMNDSLEDTAGDNDGVLNTGSPVFGDGIVDGALLLSGNAGDWAEVGETGISDSQPRTITGWVKADAMIADPAAGVFGFSSLEGATGTFFNFELQADGLVLNLNESAKALAGADQSGKWVFLTASYDGDILSWYVNGALVGRDKCDIDTADTWSFGKRYDNDALFAGAIDEVKLYNYALTDKEAAKGWTDISGGYVCIGELVLDLNHDCIVDIHDFADLAEQWMVCNRYPDCF